MYISTLIHRPIPVDMAGFAINIDLIIRNEDAVLGQMSNGRECSMLETCFLEQFTTRETVECIGGKEVYIMISILCRIFHHWLSMANFFYYAKLIIFCPEFYEDMATFTELGEYFPVPSYDCDVEC